MQQRSVTVSFFMFILINAFTMNFSFAQSQDDNHLTERQIEDGWELLFDGSSLNGWRTFKNIPGSWQVVNGSICSMKPEGDVNPDLITNDVFENFELSIDWNLSPKGNSGIMYLVTEDQDETYESGPEYQLIDDKGFPESIKSDQHTGANYAMHAPKKLAANPPGQWNTTVIKVYDGHVEHWLNGKKLLEYTIGSEEWKKEKEKGKWKDVPSYGASSTGHIALQASHSGVAESGVCFKNIRIKRL